MYGRLIGTSATALLLLGCSSSNGPTAVQAAPNSAAANAQPGCYQTSWWAETSAVIYRRFGEEQMPQPAKGDNQPDAELSECP